MSLSLSRSKSAPNPLSDIDINRTPAPAASTKKRLRWHLTLAPPEEASTSTPTSFSVNRQLHAAPFATPRRDDADDPFSLTGFFPSRPGSPSGDWAWLASSSATAAADTKALDTTPQDVGDVGAASAGAEEDIRPDAASAPIPAKKSLSMTALDRYAQDVLAAEDKFGILAPLEHIPNFLTAVRARYLGGAPAGASPIHGREEGTADDNDDDDDDISDEPPTPTTIDEAFDQDSLYESLTLRRAASEQMELARPAHVGTFGLFTPEAERAMPLGRQATEREEARRGWAGSLRALLVGGA